MTESTVRTGRVVAFRNDRLGGRLLMIVNAIRLARATSSAFCIHWHQGSDVSAAINEPIDFFDADFVAQNFIDRQSFLALRAKSVRAQDRRHGTMADFGLILAEGKSVIVDEGFGFSAYAGEDPKEVARAGAAIWREIPLAPRVREVLNEIRSAIGPDPTAYHIRRGDILSLPRVMNRPWPNKYMYDELYQTHIEATIAKGARPILFSDDDATIRRFQDRYPTLIPAQSLFDKKSVTPGQADFLELLALASCSEIIGPPQSAFSSGAAALGEVPIHDVEQSLTEDQRQLAGERLRERLREPASSTTVGPGDLGQSLEHLDRFLAKQGRLGERISILESHLQAGLEISFLFPRLVELCLLDDDLDRAIRASELMEKRQVYHRPDYAKGQILQAFAQLAKDQKADFARLCSIAVWHDPLGGCVSEGLGALYSAGHLNSGNALPFSPAASAMWWRPIFRLPVSPATAAVTSRCKTDTLGRTIVPCIDPLSWDWAPFMRSFVRGGLAKNRLRRVYERNLARLETVQPGPDIASLVAIYDMHIGEKTDWLARLISLGAEQPNDAMVQHRLSHAAHHARDFKTAIAAAERAVELAPDVPAHTLWRAIMQMRQKRYRRAINDLQAGFDAGLVFPGMYLLLAEAAAKANLPDLVDEAIEDGIRAAPRASRLLLARARRALDAGRPEAALADIKLLLNNDVVPDAVHDLHRACLDYQLGRQPNLTQPMVDDVPFQDQE